MITKGALVRIHPSALRGSRQHYGRGRVIDVDGDNVLVKPFGRHRQVESIPAKYVKLWVCKNDPEQYELTITTNEKEMDMSSNIDELKALIDPKKFAIETARKPVIQTITLEQPTQEKPRIAQSEQPNTLLDRINQYKELQQQIADEAVERLKELQNEYEEYSGIAKMLKEEMDLLREHCQSIGAIPAEPRAEAQRIVVPSATPDRFPSAIDEAMRAYSFLQQRPGIWCSGEHIKRNAPVVRQVSFLLVRYISTGQVERRGERRGVEYRAVIQ